MSEIEKKEEWYLNIDYREAKEIIRNKLQGMTQNFIGIGFYLRQIKETEGFALSPDTVLETNTSVSPTVFNTLENVYVEPLTVPTGEIAFIQVLLPLD